MAVHFQKKRLYHSCISGHILIIKQYLMLRVLKNYRGMAKFCSNNLGRKKELTHQIMQCQSAKDLQMLGKKNKGKFNLINAASLLKKYNKNFKQNKIEDFVLEEVRRNLQNQKQIKRWNARSIANIIGYMGNLNNKGLNDIFSKIKYHSFFPLLKDKEFTMAFTGLLKLALLTDPQEIEGIIRKYVTDRFEIGFLVSIWRALLQHKVCTQLLRNKLGGLIVIKPINNNIKDYGYLIYCFNKSFLDNCSPGQEQLMKGLVDVVCKYPEHILFTNKLNMFEFCNIVKYIVEIKKKKLTLDSQNQKFLICKHYQRNIKHQSLDLRTLANGYQSLATFFNMQPPLHLISQTISIYISMLSPQQQISDYESVISLFTQILQSSKHQQSSTNLDMIQPVTSFFFNSKSPQVNKITQREFQKLLYALNLYCRRSQNYSLSSECIESLRKELIRRNLNDLQIVSLLGFSNRFNKQLMEKQFCQHFGQKLEKISPQIIKNYLQNQLKNNSKCILNLKNTDCNCGLTLQK